MEALHLIYQHCAECSEETAPISVYIDGVTYPSLRDAKERSR